MFTDWVAQLLEADGFSLEEENEAEYHPLTLQSFCDNIEALIDFERVLDIVISGRHMYMPEVEDISPPASPS